MSQPSLTITHRVVSRGMLIAVGTVAGLGAIAALVYGALAQTALVTGAASIEVGVLGKELLRPDLQFPQGVDAQYSTVRFDFPPGSNPAEPLLALATGLPFIVCGLTCLVIVALAVLTLRGKPFGIGTAVSMFTVAAVGIAAGIARPALLARAEEVFVFSLGLPTEGGTDNVWLSPTPPLWDFSDWPLIIVSLLIALGGWMALRARQLRLDLEGTI